MKVRDNNLLAFAFRSGIDQKGEGGWSGVELPSNRLANNNECSISLADVKLMDLNNLRMDNGRRNKENGAKRNQLV